MMASSGIDAFVAAAQAGGRADIQVDRNGGRLRFSRSSSLKNAVMWFRGKIGLARGANARTSATYRHFLSELAKDRRGAAHAGWATDSLAPDQAVNKPLSTRKVRQILSEIDRRNADTDPEAGRFLPGAAPDYDRISHRTSSTVLSSTSLSGESEGEPGKEPVQRSPAASPQLTRPVSAALSTSSDSDLGEADDIGLLNP